MLALSILGLLMGAPLHGYQIRKQLGELLGLSGAISYGSLYPTLAKLHRQGLIDTQIGEAPALKTKTQNKAEIFSTGSLSGDIAYSTRSPFAKSSALLTNRKKKKVYTITAKGEQSFKEKLLASYVEQADNDRAFVAHLAFLNYATEPEIELFLNERKSALNSRLLTIPTSENHALKLWHDVEREYLENQISFLDAMASDAMKTSP